MDKKWDFMGGKAKKDYIWEKLCIQCVCVCVCGEELINLD